MKSCFPAHLALFLLSWMNVPLGAAPGDLDLSYNPNADSNVRGLALRPDGQMMISGNFYQVGGDSSYITRLLPDGVVDLSFGSSYRAPNALVVLPDGKMLIGMNYGGVRRLLPSGGNDSSFTNLSVNGEINALGLQSDGRIIIAGDFTTVNSVARAGLARLNANGSLDVGFNPAVSSYDEVFSLLVLPDDRILVGGDFDTVGGLAVTGLAMLSSDGIPDPAFTPTVSGTVYCLAAQADGKWLVGGNFTAATGYYDLTRLNTDGTLDTSFAPKPSGIVYSMALQADGKIVIAGDIDSVGSVRRRMLARLLPNGTTDIDFDPNARDEGYDDAYGVAIQADGAVVVGGNFTNFDLVPRGRIARVQNDGATQSLTLIGQTGVRWLRGGSSPEVSKVTFEQSTDEGITWTQLGTGLRTAGGWELNGLTLPAQGKVRAQGRTSGGYYNASLGLVEAQTGFGAQPEIVVEDTTEVLDGGGRDFGLVPVNTTGSRSFTIRNTGNADLTGLTVTLEGPDAARFSVSTSPATPVAATTGSTTFTVNFTPTAPGTRVAWLRIMSNDADESVFDLRLSGAGTSAPTVSLSAATNITTTSATMMGSVTGNGLATSVSFEWGPATTYATIHAASPSVLSGFTSSSVSATLAGLSPGTTYTYRIRAVNALGTTLQASRSFTTTAARVELPGDTLAAFPQTVEGTIYCTAVQPDGKMLVGGDIDYVNGVYPNRDLIRLNADGTHDTSFTATGVYNVRALAVQEDGKILVGQTYGMTRLNADGSTDTGFTPNVNGDVHGISVMANGRIVIVGDFTQAGGATSNRVARLLAIGVKDSTFSANLNAETYGLAVQPDGKVLVAGDFTQVNGVARRWLARLSADGTTDTSFNPATEIGYTYPTSGPRCLFVMPDGTIFVSGVDMGYSSHTRKLNSDGSVFSGYIQYNNYASSLLVQADGYVLIGTSSNRGIQRYLPTGSWDNEFNSRVDGLSSLYSLALLETGEVVAGGNFNTFGGISALGLALVGNSATTESLTVPAAGTVLWQRGGTAPEAQYVTFDYSTNQGANWTLLGHGTRVAGGWQMTGLSLPASGLLRARARVVSGMNNGSSGLVETVAAFGDHPLLVVENEVPEVLASGAAQDFGLVALAGTASQTFTIKNQGTAPLNGLTLTKDGADAAAFIVTQSPASSVAVAGSTTFTVQFSPTTSGSKQAALHLNASSLSDGKAFDLVLTGNTRPVLTVTQNLVTLPATGAVVDFGPLQSPYSVTRLFTVTNTGTRPTTALGATVLGAAAADFAAQSLPSSLAVGQSATFSVTYTPSAPGLRSATLTLQDSASTLAAPLSITLSGNNGGASVPQNLPGTTVGKPTWTRPNLGTPPTSISSTTAPYDVVSFVVPTTGTYKISCVAVTPTGWDLAMFLYGDSFSADSPLSNALTGDDDSGVGRNALLAYPLEAGRLYHLVITGWSSNLEGSYELNVTMSPPQISVEHPSLTPLVNGATTLDFGTVAATATAQKSITLRNVGAEDLRGLRAVLEGADITGFSVSPLWRNTLRFDQSFSFNVNYQPLAAGMTSQAVLRIFSNDPATPSFTVNLTGASTAPTYTLKLEQSSPSYLLLGDGSSLNFGTVTIGSAVSTRYYTLTNTGTGTLTGLTAAVDGTAASDYTLAFLPSATLAPGATTSFGLRFNPQAVGARNAALHVSTTQISNPIDLTLTGSGAAPTYAMVVEEPISVPRATNHEMAFGDVTQGISSQKRFYIRNIGTGTLTNVTLTKSGTDAGDFTLQPAVAISSLTPGTRQEVVVTCSSSNLGTKAAAVRISASNLPDPFDVQFSAAVVVPAPKIQVRQPSVLRGDPESDILADGVSEVKMPITALGATSVQTLVIENKGTAALSGLSISVSGAQGADYACTQPALLSLEPGAQTSFTVSFTPSQNGARAAVLQITSNDTASSPFDISLSSSGFSTFPTQGTTLAAPRWQRPHDDGNAVPVSVGFNRIPHEVVCFQVQTTQAYEVRSTATGGWDNFLCLYEGGFDASRPLQSLIAANDDYPLSGISACNLTLEVGKTYYAVTTGYHEGSSGGYQLTVRSTVPVISVEQPAGASLESNVSVVDFGQVAINDTRSLHVTIRNIGGAPLVLGTIQIDSPPNVGTPKYFTFQPPALTTLGPDEATTVLVSFKPGAEGQQLGQLRISSNDATKSPFIVPLRGNCTRAMPIIGDIKDTPVTWTTPGGTDFPDGYRGLTLPFKDDFFSVKVGGNYKLSTCFRHYVGRIILCLYEVTISPTGQVTHTRLIKAVGDLTGVVSIDNCPLVPGKLYCLRTSGSTGDAPGNYLVTIEPPVGTPITTHPVILGGIRVTLEGGSTPLEDDASTVHVGNAAYRPGFGVQHSFRLCTITNNGTSELILNGIRIAGPDAAAFYVLDKNNFGWPSHLRLAKGASITFKIGFGAKRIGYHSAQLYIATNLGGALREFGIQLAGNGISGIYIYPAFVVSPKPQLVFLGGRATFTASVTGADPMRLQWMKGSASIAKATTTTFTIPKVKVSDVGLFRLSATNRSGGYGDLVTSTAAYLGVVTPAPTAISIVSGKDLILNCIVNAPKEVILAYQWFYYGVPVVDVAGRISGAQTNRLIIKGILPEEAGAYHCRITMSPGTGPGITPFTPVTLGNTPTQVTVVIKPVLLAIQLPELYVGQPILQTIQALNLPTSFSVKGSLPAGVTFNKTTGLLSGKPSVVLTEPYKDYELTFSAANLAGTCLEPRTVIFRVKKLPEGTIGTYTGLIDRQSDLAPGLGGSFSAVITAGGSLSGKIRLSATEVPFSGVLEVPASGTEVLLPELLIRRGTLTSLRLQFSLDLASGRLSGQIRDGVSTLCPLTAWRTETTGLANYAGRYHSALLPPSSLVLSDPVHYPQGEGYTILVMNDKGTATWTGRLADGTAITATSTLSIGGRLPLFNLLNTNTGSLHGWSTVNSASGELDGTLSWHKIKPAVKSSTRSYNDGIPLHSLTHQGGRYQVPTSGLILGITPPATATTANSWMTLQDGALAEAFTQPCSMSSKHVLTAVPTVLNALKPAFTLSTGLLTGTFTVIHTDPKQNRPGSVNGLIVPRLGRACGHQLLPALPVTSTETVLKTDIRSGLMTLMTTAPPP